MAIWHFEASKTAPYRKSVSIVIDDYEMIEIIA